MLNADRQHSFLRQERRIYSPFLLEERERVHMISYGAWPVDCCWTPPIAGELGKYGLYPGETECMTVFTPEEPVGEGTA